MSDFFSGVTFEQQRVTPSDDAQLRRAFLPDCIITGCAFSYSGAALTMGAGSLLLCGRQIRHTAAQSWSFEDARSGYARLVVAVDLSQTATEDTFNQVTTFTQYAAAADGFNPLNQDDINAGGTIYQAAVCVVSLGASGITGIVDTLMQLSGESQSKEVASLFELDRITGNGAYRLRVPGNDATIYGINFSNATVSVEAYDANNAHQMLRKIGSPTSATRSLQDGVWSDWCIDNPPMEIGVEYRTTELWDDQPVYVKRLSFAASSISSQNTILPHGVAGLNICIAASAIWRRTDETPDGWRQLPSSDYSTGEWDGHVEYVNEENVKLRLGSKLQYRMKRSSEPVYVTLKYTRL